MSNTLFSSVAIVIPARWGSTRFPGKLLHPLGGRPLIQHVWERCSLARSISRIIIAVDDERLATVAKEFGAEVVMTSLKHQSGTDRVAEVADLLKKQSPASYPSHFINVQGDEPLIEPELIDRLAQAMLEDPSIEMITAATPFEDISHQEIVQSATQQTMECNQTTAAQSDHFIQVFPPQEGKSERVSHRNDPNIVKVVVGSLGNALYFSRSALPYHRDSHDPESAVTPLLHLGIYGFQYETLKKFVQFSPSPLERCEKLEQLRALEYGIPIRVLITNHRALGVDTPEDARRIEGVYFNHHCGAIVTS
ncbi:MAG: hypothetical protein A3F67_05225 [Verrucomicrobia bacterium RIFCSPHIGHO2_12_FULL_41_10]|nr:MAG: hypothetical protein A3F67_05225 [Verrucomicrobia bacterium RIFCSPHIGHO2_12_FULL_41_10]HLB34470.1 3-deoxy-manno-octulosonate cytidylyltransferase [Chthoniobacterales bacterium]